MTSHKLLLRVGVFSVWVCYLTYQQWDCMIANPTHALRLRVVLTWHKDQCRFSFGRIIIERLVCSFIEKHTSFSSLKAAMFGGVASSTHISCVGIRLILGKVTNLYVVCILWSCIESTRSWIDLAISCSFKQSLAVKPRVEIWISAVIAFRLDWN